MQQLAQKVKSYIKDTNYFLNKIKKLGSLPDGAIICAIDVVGFYPSMEVLVVWYVCLCGGNDGGVVLN